MRRPVLSPKVSNDDCITAVSLANDADEVEGLKDQLGGGEVLEGEGYTRSSNKKDGYAAAEDELDEQVNATS